MYEINITGEFLNSFATLTSETVTSFLPLAGSLISIPVSFYVLRKIILMFPRY